MSIVHNVTTEHNAARQDSNCTTYLLLRPRDKTEKWNVNIKLQMIATDEACFSDLIVIAKILMK